MSSALLPSVWLHHLVEDVNIRTVRLLYIYKPFQPTLRGDDAKSQCLLMGVLPCLAALQNFLQ